MPWYSVSIFSFCLEPTVREQLDENDFLHYYGIFVESTIPKLLDHSYVQSSFATIISRKMGLRLQASSEQVDAQSRPQVSTEMLLVLDMPIHCHARMYITY